MTHIETDNPLIQIRIWWYDLIVQYWYIALLVVLLYVFMEYKRHKREQCKKREQELNAYRKRKESHRDWLEKDVIELDSKDIKQIKPLNIKKHTEK